MFVDDGRIEMDNKAAERALRTVPLAGRIICLRDRMRAANVRRRSTVCSDRRN